MRKSATVRALFSLCRVVVVGNTCVSENGMAAIVGRDRRYQVCGSAHGFDDASELIRKHQPDVLLIDPFLEDGDGIRSIKDLATEFPRIRILVATAQSELIYAERALHAGAAGYWMKNGSAEELLHAVETVASDEVYVIPTINALAVRKFADRETHPGGIGFLSDRELAIFVLIAGEHGVGHIARKLGIRNNCAKTDLLHLLGRRQRYAS